MPLSEPKTEGLIALADETAPDPQSMMATYSNNQLRSIASEGYGLTKANWVEFAEINSEIVTAHRGYWGMDVSEGWQDRSWDTPADGMYEVVDQEQLEYARSSSSPGVVEEEKVEVKGVGEEVEIEMEGKDPQEGQE